MKVFHTIAIPRFLDMFCGRGHNVDMRKKGDYFWGMDFIIVVNVEKRSIE